MAVVQGGRAGRYCDPLLDMQLHMTGVYAMGAAGGGGGHMVEVDCPACQACICIHLPYVFVGCKCRGANGQHDQWGACRWVLWTGVCLWKCQSCRAAYGKRGQREMNSIRF